MISRTSLNMASSREFSPYADNGGTVVALAGEDFTLIASDTRLSCEKEVNSFIYTHNQQKLFKLSDTTVLGCTGCWADILEVTKIVDIQMQMYILDNQKPMSTPAVAQMLSTLLYYRRFLPYYVTSVLAGLDQEGKGTVYSFDPLGHKEQHKFVAVGSSRQLIQPILDNQLGYLNMENVIPEPLTQTKALDILKDVFVTAAERDVFNGDAIYINIITKDHIMTDKFELRKD